MEWYITITPAEEPTDGLDWSVKADNGEICLSAVGPIDLDDAAYWLDTAGYGRLENEEIISHLVKLGLIGK